jgi:hypothetical protein
MAETHATQPGIFPEPERTPPLTDGLWSVGPMPHRWRYMFFGEDGEWLAIEGHLIRDEELAAIVTASGSGCDPDIDDWGRYARRTWAGAYDMCPYHLTWVEGCGCCHILRDEGPPVVLLITRADPDDAERGTPDWFPVTVVDLEG